MVYRVLWHMLQADSWCWPRNIRLFEMSLSISVAVCVHHACVKPCMLNPSVKLYETNAKLICFYSSECGWWISGIFTLSLTDNATFTAYVFFVSVYKKFSEWCALQNDFSWSECLQFFYFSITTVLLDGCFWLIIKCGIIYVTDSPDKSSFIRCSFSCFLRPQCQFSVTLKGYVYTNMSSFKSA